MQYGCLLTEIDSVFFLDKKTTPRANEYLLNFLKDRRQEVIVLFLISKELKISFSKTHENIVYLHKETDNPIKYRLIFPWAISKEQFIYFQNTSLVATIEEEIKSSPLSADQFIIISSNQTLLDSCKKFNCETQITFWEGALDLQSTSKLKKKLDNLDENCAEIEFLYDIDGTLSMHGASKAEECAVINRELVPFLKPYVPKFNKATHSILSSRPDIFKAFITILSELKKRASAANIDIPQITNFEIIYEVNFLYLIINKLIGACNDLTKAYNSDPNYDAESDAIFAELKDTLTKNDNQLLHHSSTFMILNEFQEQTQIQLSLNEFSFTGGKVTKESIVEKKRKENPKRLLVVFEDILNNILDLVNLEDVIAVKIMREDDFEKPLKEKLALIKEREISNSQGDEESFSTTALKIDDSDDSDDEAEDESDNKSDEEFDISTQEITELQGKLEEVNKHVAPKKRKRTEIEKQEDDDLEEINKPFANSQTDFFKIKAKHLKTNERTKNEDKKPSPEIIIIDDDETEKESEQTKAILELT